MPGSPSPRHSPPRLPRTCTPAYVSIRQRCTPAYVSIRQHTSALYSAYVSKRQHTSALYSCIRQHS
jgi:hypothetical protein